MQLTWQQAAQACEAQGANLVHIEDYLFYSFFLFSFTDGCDLTCGGICYTFHNVEVPWKQAAQACEAKGTHLVDIENNLFHSFLFF